MDKNIKASTYRETLRADGFCVVENALSSEQLNSARTRFVQQAAAEAAMNASTGQNHANNAQGNQWVGMLLNKGDIFFDLIDHPHTTELISSVLGADYTISAFDGHIQHPGADAMAPHIDQWWMPQPRPASAAAQPGGLASDVRRGRGQATVAESATTLVNPAVAASVMFMLTDFTAENGATRIARGSHLSGAQPDPSVPWHIETEAIIAKAGSAMVFDGRLWHCAGANTSSEPRMGVLAYYCAPFCRPLENYLTGMHQTARRNCPERILARLGYRSWQMYGHTGDLTGDAVAENADVIGQMSPGK